MADSEKLTINLSVVDLGHIDLLVDEGFYSNRSDFIRAAIRAQLNLHQDALKQAVVRKSMAIGVLNYDRADLERCLAKGEKLAIRVVGLVTLADDIPAELAHQTIDSIIVHGVLRASSEVRQALAGRISAS
jgi:Arc/MetJ-type ribon-helix-helix transcriptional regulator